MNFVQYCRWVAKETDKARAAKGREMSEELPDLPELPEQDHVVHATDSETIDCFRADQMRSYGASCYAAGMEAAAKICKELGADTIEDMARQNYCAASIRACK